MGLRGGRGLARERSVGGRCKPSMGALQNASLHFDAPDRPFTREPPPLRGLRRSWKAGFFSSLPLLLLFFSFFGVRAPRIKAVARSRKDLGGGVKIQGCILKSAHGWLAASPAEVLSRARRRPRRRQFSILRQCADYPQATEAHPDHPANSSHNSAHPAWPHKAPRQRA